MANRTSRRHPSRERAKATKPAPIPTTVVVGIVTPDSTWWVPDEVGEGEVVVGEGVVVEDMAIAAGFVLIGLRGCFRNWSGRSSSLTSKTITQTLELRGVYQAVEQTEANDHAWCLPLRMSLQQVIEIVYEASPCLE